MSETIRAAAYIRTTSLGKQLTVVVSNDGEYITIEGALNRAGNRPILALFDVAEIPDLIAALQAVTAGDGSAG